MRLKWDAMIGHSDNTTMMRTLGPCDTVLAFTMQPLTCTRELCPTISKKPSALPGVVDIFLWTPMTIQYMLLQYSILDRMKTMMSLT